MVLSNKKLKQKLREELEKSVANTSNGDATYTETPKSLKQLLNTAILKPILSKREKRRKSLPLKCPDGENKDSIVDENGGKWKKRKREKNGDEVPNKEEKRRIREKDGGKDELGVKEEDEVSDLSKASKKNSKKKKKSEKMENKEEKQSEFENGGIVEQGVADKVDLSSSQGNDEDTKKVYVGGIPYYSTEDDIRSYFDHCGTITDVDCMTFSESGKFRGIAIISFKTEEAAKRAFALDGSDMGGLYLKIQPYKTTRTTKTSDFFPPVLEGYNRIYAGNLSWDITEDDLRKLFSDCNITSIRFGEDKDTGEFKGYAHVDFADNVSLTKALKLNQTVICGRPVKISSAVPKKGGELVPKKGGAVTNMASASAPTVVKAENNSEVGSGKLKRRTCYECGEKGHISSACPKKQATDQANPSAS